MPLYLFVWLSVIALLLAASSARATNSDFYRSLRWSREIPTTRFPQDSNALSLENDERAGIPVSAIEKIKALLQMSSVSPKTLRHWVNKGKSKNAVFIRLKLDQAGDNLLSNPQFVTWVAYADDFNAKFSEKATPLLSTLKAQYRDEVLSEILIAGKKVPSTEKLASRLQAEQLEGWVIAKLPKGEVFKLLKLNDKLETFLTNPQLSTWVEYMEKFVKKYPDEKTPMIKELTKSYGNEMLARMLATADSYVKDCPDGGLESQIIEAALKADNPPAFAKILQAEQSKRWLDGEKSVDDIFTLLRLNKAGKNTENLLARPQFSTWEKYLYDTKIIDTLAKSYDDSTLWNILARAYKDHSTEEMAKSLQVALLNKWLSDNKPHGDVFRLLDVKGTSPDHPSRLFYNMYRHGKVY
ncbi:hypothetical protein GN958_ATG11618 [Phytophthora infestans]|uniref:RxLR effector PexRD54 WY domain-containing protein n=1 Tax=Phytophthora infestans TaxID=4787 RepID=A0A8S9ULI5_PHYIN|nr:hypothetical protein GN958_ATG11618 [Phytophthora infestans]